MYILVSLLFLVCAHLYAEPQIVFQARPERVEIGESVVLSWRVTNADGVYLTNFGRVEPNGQIKVDKVVPKSANTIFFTIIAQNADGVATASVSIDVKGGRGDAFPNEDQFSNEYMYKISAPSLIRLLDGFHAALQDKMKFVVDERYDRRTGKTVFVTKIVERRKWVKKDERRIRSRKLAYWVEVEENKEQAGSYIYRIKTFIQYQRRKETKWRTERQQALYRENAVRLRQNVQSILAKKE